MGKNDNYGRVPLRRSRGSTHDVRSENGATWGWGRNPEAPNLSQGIRFDHFYSSELLSLLLTLLRIDTTSAMATTPARVSWVSP